MTQFQYVYEGWEDDEALDKIFSFVIQCEIPLDLWELMKEDVRNCPNIFRKVGRDGSIKMFNVPLKILREWIETEMYYQKDYDRLLERIFNLGARNIVHWWGPKGLTRERSIYFGNWPMAQEHVNDWIAIQKDWYGKERGKVFQKDRHLNFYSGTLSKWVAVRQFQTMGKHISNVARI